MGSLRTQLCRVSICLIALAPAPPLYAQTPPDPLAVFAVCTGRLSAVMEFQWLVQGSGSAQTKVWRDAMAGLLDAVTPAGAQSRTMALRIGAKVAAAGLLQAVRFGADPVAADWARRRAARLVADCTALMLS